MTTVGGEGRSSNALTRDAVRLEIAMRLVIEGEAVKVSWDAADEFVREMDKRLDPLPEPPPPNGRTNADRPIPDLLK